MLSRENLIDIKRKWGSYRSFLSERAEVLTAVVTEELWLIVARLTSSNQVALAPDMHRNILL